MYRTLPKSGLWVAMFALVALGWTDDRALRDDAAADSDVAQDDRNCGEPERCPFANDGYLTHWISRTGGGNLFLVMRTDCRTPDRCSAWFVERTSRGYATRLNIEGQFRVLSSGKSIPDVQTWRALSDNETEYTRYTWMAGAYVRAGSQRVYSVDGEECGTALECYHKATAANQNHDAGKALKIWETVHNLSWI